MDAPSVSAQQGWRAFVDVAQGMARRAWSARELRERIAELRDRSAARYRLLRERAAGFGSQAMRRGTQELEALQKRTLASLGLAARPQVEHISQELDRLERRIEKAEKGARSRKGASRGRGPRDRGGKGRTRPAV